MSCGRITRGSQVDDCDDLAPLGTRARLILINFDDVLRIYTNADNKITEIILQSQISGGIVLDAELDAEFDSDLSAPGAFEFTGFRNDVKKSEEVVSTGRSHKRYLHALSFVIYEVDQLQKTNIKDLCRGRFLAIVESNGETDDSIEVLGRECGLQILEGRVRDAHETNGVFTLNFSTPDNGVEYERRLPQTLGIDYDDGLSLIDDLLREEPDEPEEPDEEGVFDLSFDETFS